MNWELGSLYIFPNSFLGKKKLKKPNTIIHKKWSTYFSIRQVDTLGRVINQKDIKPF